MVSILGGIFLGWSLGANDASNVFGSAVTSKMVRFRTAALLCAGFVLLGAWLEGAAGIKTQTTSKKATADFFDCPIIITIELRPDRPRVSRQHNTRRPDTKQIYILKP